MGLSAFLTCLFKVIGVATDILGLSWVVSVRFFDEHQILKFDHSEASGELSVVETCLNARRTDGAWDVDTSKVQVLWPSACIEMVHGKLVGG